MPRSGATGAQLTSSDSFFPEGAASWRMLREEEYEHEMKQQEALESYCGGPGPCTHRWPVTVPPVKDTMGTSSWLTRGPPADGPVP